MRDFQKLKSLIDIGSYLTSVLGRSNKKGKWHCPFHNDRDPSLSVKDGGYTCFPCQRKGDVFRFVQEHQNVSDIEAYDILAEWANLPDDKKPPGPPAQKKEPRVSATLPDGWRHFIFRNAAGEEVGAEVRKDVWDSKKREMVKQTYMYRKNDEGKWISRALEAPRPLYHLDDMVMKQGTAPLYVVEGAKCAEAVIAAGQRCTTWMGGTNALGKTDFTPLIQAGVSSEVILISDGDAPGRKAMRKIRKQLLAGGCEKVKIYSLGGRSGKDIADYLEENDGSWGAAFATVEAKCPKPDVAPLITSDDILDQMRENKEFNVLGYQKKSIAVVRKPTGKIVHLPSANLTDGNMTEICPEAYFWTGLFENPMATLNNYPRREAHRALTIISEERGLWQPKSQIGRGLAFIPGEGYFLHMGDRVEPLLMDKKTKAFGIGEKSAPNKVFVPRPPLDARPKPCRPSEFKELNDMLNEFSWEEPFGATLMLAWICASLIGGATYRPHLRLVSGPDKGKNWLMDTVILPILGDMYNDGGGDATVAGISAKAMGDALPFIINEVNPNTRQMRDKISNLQQLMLGAFDPEGTPILRATQDGEMREAYVRCSFLTASNHVLEESEASASRTFQLSMTGELNQEEFRDLDSRVEEAVDKYAAGIRGLMLSKAEAILSNLKDVTQLVQDTEEFRLSGRMSRNVALLTACHASLYPHGAQTKRDNVLISARQIVAAMGEQIKSRDSIVDAIVSMRDQQSRISLKETWIKSHSAGARENSILQDAIASLKASGVMIKQATVKGVETACLFVNPASSDLRNHLARDSSWAGMNIKVELGKEPGSFKSKRRFYGKALWAYAVPLGWQLDDEEIVEDGDFVSTKIKPNKIVGIDT